jgi:acyl-CoA thioesterase-1
LGKEKIIVFLLFIITISVFVLGNKHYNDKLKDNYKKALAEAAVQAKEDEKTAKENALKKKKEEELKIAEQKSVFTKHKGETLTYIPMGDSLGAGFAAYDSGHRYVNVFQELLNEKMGFNVSMPKELTVSGRGVKDEGLPNIPVIEQYKPDLVTIEFGTNDMDKTKITYADPDSFSDELDSLVKNIQSVSPNTKIILVTTWRNGQPSFLYDNIIENVGEKK